MPLPAANAADPWKWRKYTFAQRAVRWVGWIVVLTIILVAWRMSTLEQNWGILGGVQWERVLGVPLPVPDVLYIAGDLLARAFPPDLGYVPELMRPLWDTLNIATLGTLLALLLATPLAFLAASNTSPHPVLRAMAIFVIVSTRSVNTLIWGIVLVVIIGPGVLAGIIAIAIRSIGFIGKLTYEAIEEVDRGPVTAIESTGASRLQVISHAIVPQIKPAFAGISVFRWDINIRESAIIGYVGAGGLGLHLRSSVDFLAWDRAMTILLFIIALVLLSEAVSAIVRAKVT